MYVCMYEKHTLEKNIKKDKFKFNIATFSKNNNLELHRVETKLIKLLFEKKIS